MPNPAMNASGCSYPPTLTAVSLIYSDVAVKVIKRQEREGDERALKTAVGISPYRHRIWTG